MQQNKQCLFIFMRFDLFTDIVFWITLEVIEMSLNLKFVFILKYFLPRDAICKKKINLKIYKYSSFIKKSNLGRYFYN